MRRKLNKFERERVSLKALKARRGKVRALPPPPRGKRTFFPRGLLSQAPQAPPAAPASARAPRAAGQGAGSAGPRAHLSKC